MLTQILAYTASSIGSFLRFYELTEQYRLANELADPPNYPVESAKEKIPRIFARIWEFRHTLLPVPQEKGHKTAQLGPLEDSDLLPDQRLEWYMSYFTGDHETVFAFSE